MIPLDNSPDHSSALGRMLGHWATIELHLSDLLGIFLGVDQLKMTMLNSAFTSVPSKIKLIDRLCRLYVVDSKEKEDLLQILKDLEELNAERNSFVHSLWGAGSTSDTLTKIDTRPPNKTSNRVRPTEELKASDIQDFVSRIQEKERNLDVFKIKDIGHMQFTELPQDA